MSDTISLDVNDINSWRSIVTLIVFILTSECRPRTGDMEHPSFHFDALSSSPAILLSTPPLVAMCLA